MANQPGQQRKVDPQKLAISGFSVPASVRQWEANVRAGRLGQTSIHQLAGYYLNSGSRINHTQFTLMRVLFPCILKWREIDDQLATYGLREAWSAAGTLVNFSSEATNYLRMVRDDIDIKGLDESHQNWPGSFKPVRMLQEQVMTVDQVPDRARIERQGSSGRRTTRSMSRHFGFGQGDRGRSSYARARSNLPEGEDESTPNAALILLLQSLSQLVTGSSLEWVLNRHTFSPSFRRGGYNAETDGVMRSTNTGDVMAIVEVKRRRRYEPGMIEMQEAAEMVGWLTERTGRTPNLNNHRLIVSQNRDQIFVTFASWPATYLDYLDRGNGAAANNAFLTMQRYWPWFIYNDEEMRHFAQLMVAFTIVCKQTT